MSAGPAGDAGGAPVPYRCRVFGLDVDCDWPLAGSSEGPATDGREIRRVSVRRVAPAEIDDAWHSPGEPLLTAADGGVERSADCYRLWVEGFGRYLVSADGTFIGCERDAAPPGHHERFVFAQALPVAAVLQGLEVLHASAVGSASGAVAFTGASGAGKTTLAGGLVRRGATFLTDDVLALEADGDAALVHPGPAFMAMRPDAARLDGGGHLGDSVGRTDKLHFSPSVPGEPALLRAIYHLESGDAIEIAGLRDAGAQRVLSLAFVPYIRPPARLMRHLELAQLLGRHVPQFAIRAPRLQNTEAVLDAVQAHMRGIGL